MHWRRIISGVGAFAFALLADAGTRDVQVAELPSWVTPAPAPTDAPAPDGVSVRVIYLDNQVRLGPDGMEIFQAFRLKILRPEALSAGNISLTWSPDAGDAKIHFVRIIRDDGVIDVLKSTEFRVVQREGELERAALNGQLTAALQSPGLRVGDEFEFAATTRHKDPTLGDHWFGFAKLPPNSQLGAFRIRMIWPSGSHLRWRASADATGITTKTAGGQTELVYELRDPHSAVVADGAPARVNIRRFIEYSDFDHWADVSRRIAPLFEKASALAPDSPVRREIARIASADSDPGRRAEAALKLVQEQIRYVYIGLNGGNFMPATADETWDRRFGDCKAKTALLLAMLRELGIRGEAVLVNYAGADGINERLPTPGIFDHVLVRATVGNSTYWLDGSRLGDWRLAAEAPRPFRWVLPLRQGGSDLEPVPANPPRWPDSITVLDIDASMGFDREATVKVQQVLRGDSALAIRAQLMVLSPEDANKAVMAFWRQGNGWMQPTTASWRYDEPRGALLLTMTGEGKLDWTGNAEAGRTLDIPGGGFTPPNEFHRPKEQDQTAPWTTGYPGYSCRATAIHLPTSDPKWKWDYLSDPVDTRMGGVRYWRVADLRDGVVRTVTSKRFEVPEISAKDAEEVNKRLPKFDKKMSSVFQIGWKDDPSKHDAKPAPPFQADTDWTTPDAPCGPPAV